MKLNLNENYFTHIKDKSLEIFREMDDDFDQDWLHFYSYPFTSAGTSLMGCCGQQLTSRQAYVFHNYVNGVALIWSGYYMQMYKNYNPLDVPKYHWRNYSPNK